MTSFRLLPIVIAAGLALLVLKGVGLVTQGSYVLTGTTLAQAAGGHEADGVTATGPLGQPTMVDESPTLTGTAPTLPLAAHGATTDGDADEGHKLAEAETDDAAAEAMAGGAAPTDDGSDDADELVPMITNGAGDAVPLASTAPSSEEAVLARLSERRAELEAREEELDMRLALIEAAEQRIDERTAALEALEARIAALVDEKKTLEEEHFVSIVAMYETMKARDAAAIFDKLAMPVLLRVARAISPRKMAPIMAEMDPVKARDLTASMAIDRTQATLVPAGDDLSSLPQIVGE